MSWSLILDYFVKAPSGYIFQRFVMATTVFLSAGASGYATYLGLETSLPAQFSLVLALVSAFLLVALSYLIVELGFSRGVWFWKIVLTPFFIGAIFSFSTLWSLVGIARDELFAKQVEEINGQLLKKYKYDEIKKYFNDIDYTLNLLFEQSNKAYEDEKSGKFSGSLGEGGVSANFKNLKEQAELIRNNLTRANTESLEKIKKIDKDISNLLDKKRFGDKKEYILSLNQIIREYNLLDFDKTKTSIAGCISFIDNTSSFMNDLPSRPPARPARRQRVRSFRAVPKFNEGNINLIKEEVAVYQNIKKQLEDLSKREFEKIEINLNLLETPITTLSFRYWLDILNWWALAFVIDFTPLAILVFVRRKQMDW